MADFPTEQTKCLAPKDRWAVCVDRAKIEASDALQPCAAVQLETACSGLGFSAVSVFLEGAQLEGVAPVVHWQLRGRHGGVTQSEAIPGASGVLANFETAASEGSIVHVSGRRYLGFELWAYSEGAAIRCRVRFVTAPACAGAPLFVQTGALVS